MNPLPSSIMRLIPPQIDPEAIGAFVRQYTLTRHGEALASLSGRRAKYLELVLKAMPPLERVEWINALVEQADLDAIGWVDLEAEPVDFGHTYRDGREVWRVEALWAAAEGCEVFEVDPRDMFEELEREAWGKISTPFEALSHFVRISRADLDCPITLGPKGELVDGVHRLCRATIERREALPARRLDRMPNPDYVARFGQLYRLPKASRRCAHCSGHGRVIWPDGLTVCEDCEGFGYVAAEGEEGWSPTPVREGGDRGA